MAPRHRDMYTDDWVTVLYIATTLGFLVWLGVHLAG